MPRQANGQGERPQMFTTKAGAKRWRARYSIMRDGKQVRHLVTGKTAKEVRDRIGVALGATGQGLEAPDNRATIASWAEHWRKHVLPSEGLAPATVQWYSDVLDAYVLPTIGAKTLTGPRALTVGDVEALMGSLAARGLSVRVQKATRTTISKLLHAAMRYGRVSRNVARLASPPRDRGDARTIKALRRSDLASVLAAVEDTRLYPLVLVHAATGLRPGEVLGLRWADLHLRAKEPQLAVRVSLSHVGGATLKAPKRQRSYRTVPLPSEAVEVLQRWRHDQRAERAELESLGVAQDELDLVFTTADGAPMRVDVYRKALRRALEAAGLPHTSPHAFRHTYATHLLEAGTPIQHVAELLGDSVAVVESTYSHVLRPKHEVTSLVAGLIGGSSQS